MGELIEKNKIYEAVYDLACKSAGVIGCISEDYACGLREAAHMIEEAVREHDVEVVTAEAVDAERPEDLVGGPVHPDER